MTLLLNDQCHYVDDEKEVKKNMQNTVKKQYTNNKDETKFIY